MEEQFRILANRIKDYEYVSFDLFDTLALRTVAKPTDIFALVEERYNERFSARLRCFTDARVSAESRARAGRPEVTIDDIYAQLSLGKKYSVGALKELEKETEIQSIVPYREMIEVLEECRARGQKIVITTDMYLDPATIKAILAKAGAVYDELFISGEAGCTKMSGALYGHVLRTLNIGPDRIVHIGDDKLKDVLMARRNGIASLRCPIFPPPVPPAAPLADEICEHVKLIGHVLGRKGASPRNVFFDMGYKTLGPFLAAFCRWLKRLADEQKSDRIAFVAREGYLVKQAYETAFPDEKERTCYVCLNKNLLRFPIMHLEPTAGNFLSTVPTQNSYTLGELFYYFGMDDGDKRRFFDELGESIAEDESFPRETLSSDARFNGVLNALVKTKRAEIQKQYSLFVGYVGRAGFDKGSTLLVNNSFDGNGQRLLYRIMELSGMNPNSVYGAQFACSGRGYAGNPGRVAGYINTVAGNLPAYSFSRFALVFERMLFEPQGTALGMGENGIIFEPHEPEAPNDETVAAIGAHALDFVADNAASADIAFDKFALEGIMRLFERPDFDEALTLGDLLDYDAHGLHRLIEVGGARLSTDLRAVLEVRRLKNVHWRQGIMTLLSVSERAIELSTRINRHRQKKIMKKEMKSR